MGISLGGVREGRTKPPVCGGEVLSLESKLYPDGSMIAQGVTVRDV
ncbi:hypothetical protein ACFL6X_04420 [Candidatus Latescibacterota bacterium]